MKSNYLIIEQSGKKYAVSADNVREIVCKIQSSIIPYCPDFVVGATNFRGKVLPIIDLGIRLYEPSDIAIARYVFIEIHNLEYALKVDNAFEVITVDPKDVAINQQHLDEKYKESVQGVINFNNERIVELSLISLPYKNQGFDCQEANIESA